MRGPTVLVGPFFHSMGKRLCNLNSDAIIKQALDLTRDMYFLVPVWRY